MLAILIILITGNNIIWIEVYWDKENDFWCSLSLLNIDTQLNDGPAKETEPRDSDEPQEMFNPYYIYGKLKENAKPYANSSEDLAKFHPLKIMVSELDIVFWVCL